MTRQATWKFNSCRLESCELRSKKHELELRLDCLLFPNLGVVAPFAGALESIVIVYPTTSSQFTPLWFARDVGLYEKYGLDGKLVYIKAAASFFKPCLRGKPRRRQTALPKR